MDWKGWMGEKRAVLRRWYVPCVLGLGTPRKGLDSKVHSVHSQFVVPRSTLCPELTALSGVDTWFRNQRTTPTRPLLRRLQCSSACRPVAWHDSGFRRPSMQARHRVSGRRPGEAWYLGIVSLLIATPVYAFMFFSPELIHTILGASASPWMVDMLNGTLL